MTPIVPTEKRLHDLGFVTAASEMKLHKEIVTPELRDKLRIAFEFYRVVEPHHIERFNKDTRTLTFKRTKIRNKQGRHTSTKNTWLELKFETIHCYPAAPPPDVLDKLAEARQRGCFDGFEVATLVQKDEYMSVPVRMPDPILFGRIDGSENRYFIAQWDDDVRIEDILKEDEG